MSQQDPKSAAMVQRAMKFTPQVLLSAPRRSAGVPNPSGTQVLFTTSTYSFETHKKTTELRVLAVDSGESHQLVKDDDISDINWLNDDDFACLQAEKDGTTSVYVASVSKVVGKSDPQSRPYYVAGTIDAPAANLKVKRLDERGEEFAVVVSAEAGPDRRLFNPEKAKKTRATGVLYTSLFVRHWDRWETKEKNALWYGKLSKNGSEDGEFKLSSLTNALKGTALESPIRPFGGTDHFDVADDRVVFVAKDPDLNPALNTKCNVYVVKIGDWEGNQSSSLAQLYLEGFEGAASSPVFSPDGKEIAFLSMKINGYEADKNRLFIVSSANTLDGTPAKPLAISEKWDRSPQSVVFSSDGKTVIVVAESIGATQIFLVDPLSKSHGDERPRPLTNDEGSISDVRPLLDGRIFVSGSTIVDNSFYAIIDSILVSPALRDPRVTWKNSNSSEGSKFGLKSSQVSSIWTPASNPEINKQIHNIVFRPSTFEKGKKYPVAFLIHGGPQSAWGFSWSTRWNPAVFAEQGYIVVAPNPTGSTGYGQAFTDAIRGNWGGDPYQDIVNSVDWVAEHMPEADMDRAVALGASYGGYMMNWIQGHALGRRFKALVCHDGITTLSGLLSTEELYFPMYDLDITAPWHDPGYASVQTQPQAAHHHHPSSSSSSSSSSNDPTTATPSWRKWDPSAHFTRWATPQLVIHSARDYRLPLAEGLAAFNVLQARGVESQLLTFPDENHWVLKPENGLLWHRVVLGWINRFVGLEGLAAGGENGDGDGEEMFYGGLRDEEEEEGVAEMAGG